MENIDTFTAERFVVAAGALITFKASTPFEERRLTVMFTYGAPGRVREEYLAWVTAEHDIDVIHFEFEAGREIHGPINVALCEDRNGMILIWPECHFWGGTDGRVFLLVLAGQDFGFALDGAALVRVTDVPTGIAFKQGVARARKR